MAVDPGERGAGVGQLLVDACIERALAAGAKVLAIHTAEIMAAAIRIYAATGFERAPEFDLRPADFLGPDYAGGPKIIAMRLEPQPLRVERASRIVR